MGRFKLYDLIFVVDVFWNGNDVASFWEGRLMVVRIGDFDVDGCGACERRIGAVDGIKEKVIGCDRCAPGLVFWRG